MSYFNPQENISEIFLPNKDIHYFFENHQDYLKNKHLDLDFEFQDQSFSFDFFDDNSQKIQFSDDIKKSHDKIKRKKRIFKPRYEKNICGYILKKTLRAFVHSQYQINARMACDSTSASFNQVEKFCLSKMEKLNGISSPHSLLMPKNKKQINQRQALLAFTEWFVQQRYIRHLIYEGKMKQKQKYINFKNQYFLKQINRLKIDIQQFKTSSC